VTATGRPEGFAAPSTWPKRPARLAVAVVDVLVDRIVSGELEPEALLPTESGLSEAFSVSRTVIREAVKILEEKGLVHAKQGHGTKVAVPDEWNLLDPMVLAASVRHDKDLRLLDDLVQVRRVLESDMAGQAAEKATLGDRAEIKRLLDRMTAETVMPDRHMLTDLQFHDSIMRASGNRLGRAIVRTIQSEARTSDLYNGYPEPADCAASNVGHAKIYDRIAGADPGGAVAAMSEHILSSWLARRNEPGPRSPED
jgi:DNA-binding FadR family transcriptional regulator